VSPIEGIVNIMDWNSNTLDFPCDLVNVESLHKLRKVLACILWDEVTNFGIWIGDIFLSQSHHSS